MANQSVSKPRFWLDFTQLLRAKGYFADSETSGLTVSPDKIYSLREDDVGNVWKFDYTNPTVFNGLVNLRWKFIMTDPPDDLPKEWRKLLSTINWLGFINHNLGSVWNNQGGYSSSQLLGMIKFSISGSTGYSFNHTLTDYVNGDFSYNGYSIYTVSPDAKPIDASNYWDRIEIGFQNLPSWVDSYFELGAIPFGKYIDIDSSPDLSVKKTVEYDGSKSYRTLGGSDISTSDYQGQPDWVVGEPWTLYYTNLGFSYSPGRVGRNGRRSWELTFSYLSNDDVFYDWQELVVGGSAETSDGVEGDFNSTSEIQQIWDLTLGGALSFVFTPDKDATNPEFAVCKLDQDSLVATQVAFQTWNISMVVREVW